MKVKLTNGYKGFVVEFLDRKNISKNALRIAKIVVIDEILGEGTDLATIVEVNSMWLERVGEDATPQKLIVNDQVVEESDLEYVENEVEKHLVSSLDDAYFDAKEDSDQYGVVRKMWNKGKNVLKVTCSTINNFETHVSHAQLIIYNEKHTKKYESVSGFIHSGNVDNDTKEVKEKFVKLILKGGYYDRDMQA